MTERGEKKRMGEKKITRFEKLILLLLVVYISVFVGLILAIRSHSSELREFAGACRRAGDRPMKIEVKQVK